MQIFVQDQDDEPQSYPAFTLRHSTWNDWWEFETQYMLTYWDAQGDATYIGMVKIATPEMAEKRPDLPDEIPNDFSGAFSLGQDATYYETLHKVSAEAAKDVLRRLGDIAYDPERLMRVLNLDVTQRSLLRSVPLATVKGQLARTAKGGARLTPYTLTFQREDTPKRGGIAVDFQVKPESSPPTNIHVLVGRNGAGKSTLLGDILEAYRNRQELGASLSLVIAVSFSAFDTFGEDSAWNRDPNTPIQAIGLKRPSEDPFDPVMLKDPEVLKKELESALDECMNEPKRSRLIRVLEILENDPIFAESNFSGLIAESNKTIKHLLTLYRDLSSGHKIVLLTMARLVQTVEEKKPGPNRRAGGSSAPTPTERLYSCLKRSTDKPERACYRRYPLPCRVTGGPPELCVEDRPFRSCSLTCSTHY